MVLKNTTKKLPCPCLYVNKHVPALVFRNTTADFWEAWFEEQCEMAHAKYGRVMFIMDGASSHKRKKNKPPNKSATKAEYVAFLKAHGVANVVYAPFMKRLKNSSKVLYNMCQAAAPPDFKRFECYRIAEQYGHIVLFLPPYTPELNPIEQCWGYGKNKVANLDDPTMIEVNNCLRTN